MSSQSIEQFQISGKSKKLGVLVEHDLKEGGRGLNEKSSLNEETIYFN